MRLAVDARWMHYGCRGMGLHAYTLLEPVLEGLTAFMPSGSEPLSCRSIVSGPTFYPVWEQFWLPSLCKAHKVTHLVCPYNTAPLALPRFIKLILVVHDLIYLKPWSEIPPSLSRRQELGRFYRKTVLPGVIHKASHIVTVSAYSQQKISETFGIPKSRIFVIPNSIDHDWFVFDPMPLHDRRSYILTVSGEAPSKNLATLIRAFARLKYQGSPYLRAIQLRVVGVKAANVPPFANLARQLGLESSVIFEAYVDRSDLMQLYRHALLFVLPSLYEGFGIPIIEAMASGTPVACSRVASLPEVLGDFGWYFDPLSPLDIANTICTALSDPVLYGHNALHALLRVKKYNKSSVAYSASLFWRHVQ
jgi:glycosyltransferase involved in cell wall biosynthesis